MNDPILIWFVIGAVLFLLEFAAPGLVILFFGLGAWVVALFTYLGIVDSWSAQILLFSIASILSLVLLRKYLKSWFVGDSEAEEGELDTEFIHQQVLVVRDIPGGHGMGRIELKGADWKAWSDQAHTVGSMVIVTERDGLTLKVKSI